VVRGAQEDAIIEHNTIRAGSSPSGSMAEGAWAVQLQVGVVFDSNLVNTPEPNSLNLTDVCSGTILCGGLRLIGASGATVTNNVIFGVRSPNSVGLLVTEIPNTPLANVAIHNNYLDGGGYYATGGPATNSSAIVFVPGMCTAQACPTYGGTFYNNFILGGQGYLRYGIYESDFGNGQHEIHPDYLQYNDFWYVTEANVARAVFTFYRRTTTASTKLIQDLSSVNNLQAEPMSGNNLWEPTGTNATYHLVEGSPCIDKGKALPVPLLDFDGQTRPTDKVDIGPDEFFPAL
jgi:hypothetical protein